MPARHWPFALGPPDNWQVLKYPGASGPMDQTWCTGMNVHGDIDIVGQYQDAGKKTHGFLRTRMGKVISLDFPDATTTSAWKVNDAGVVVGYYWDNATPSVSHGFVWLDGVFIQKDYPGAVHTMIHGFNSDGEFCGMVSFTPLPTTPVWGGFSRTW